MVLIVSKTASPALRIMSYSVRPDSAIALRSTSLISAKVRMGIMDTPFGESIGCPDRTIRAARKRPEQDKLSKQDRMKIKKPGVGAGPNHPEAGKKRGSGILDVAQDLVDFVLDFLFELGGPAALDDDGPGVDRLLQIHDALLFHLQVHPLQLGQPDAEQQLSQRRARDEHGREDGEDEDGCGNHGSAAFRDS